MQEDIANVFRSIEYREAVMSHAPSLAPLCAAQFLKDGTRAVIHERWQAGTQNSATYVLDVLNPSG